MHYSLIGKNGSTLFKTLICYIQVPFKTGLTSTVYNNDALQFIYHIMNMQKIQNLSQNLGVCFLLPKFPLIKLLLKMSLVFLCW